MMGRVWGGPPPLNRPRRWRVPTRHKLNRNWNYRGDNAKPKEKK